MFPLEVVEKILLYCDGKTLKTAENVCTSWRELSQYLAQKHNLWKKCVHQDIPEQELLQYKSKWITDSDEEINWEDLYDNWLNWQDIQQNIEFHESTIWKINKVSCTCVCGDYIAIGLSNGSVKVFDMHGHKIKAYRHLIIPVQSIHFVKELPDCIDNKPPTELLIAYRNKVYINDFLGNYNAGIFCNCFIFSNYKRFICGVSQEGHITISKVSNDDENQRKSFDLVTFARIYSPDTVKSCTLLEGVCIILVNNKVRIINYKEGSKSSQLMSVELTQLQFFTVDNFLMRRDVFIFHDKVIVTVTKSIDIMQQQLFELFILNEDGKSHSKKMFIPWRVFHAFITCVYLYGNTLVIGLSSGYVYFYVIDDWKLFNIANYSTSLRLCDVEPIISIDAVESSERRVFYIASNTFVRELIGQTVN